MSTKKKSGLDIYRVKVTLRIPGFQILVFEGMYIPENETANAKKLKEECCDHIAGRINWDKLGITRDQCAMEVTYKVLHNTFLVREGQQD